MAKQGKLTRNAKAFIAASASGPVAEQGKGPHGGVKYRLPNGREFTLDARERRAVGAYCWQGETGE